ncbi:3'-5' ssDNA/RNA exonuclease TatD [Sinobacterium norvegicum]|uniref:3'-5' ssDNA/RNA exonuclease TatD n=1 Tax=Sinobacterium norvegicum TaxID=1641715 RepID=A0ABM9A9P0_9GAMM|nr:TatD family hydrolase [Sinobacterium norvegicum]CAH0989972.1 3'-5' ssDNA/RNA exonuclease TatD [Sinobacterium norvegicum]
MYTDIGLNLTNPQFDKDRDAVIERALACGVDTMILTGTTLAESQGAHQLCLQHPEHMWSTAGIHPHHASDYNDELWLELTELMKQPAVVAIGETGLDFNRNFSTPAQQQWSFEKHIEAAISLQRPMFLHERDAGKRMVEMLASHRDQLTDAVIHCFTGSKETLYSYLDLDLYIGVTGWVCDERRGEELQQLCKEIPNDRLLIETDAPYLIPRDLNQASRPEHFNAKTRRNEPCVLPHIATAIAALRSTSGEQIAHLSQQNASRLFGID